MSKEPLVDLSKIDLNRILAGPEEIRKLNPQRHEMEQITAYVWEDLDEHIGVGYKDVTREEFWIRGHMPGMPLMPGVIMLEAAAQMCSYYVQRHDLLKSQMVGFGGLDDVSFRNFVIPGDRLVLVSQLTKVREKRMIMCKFQGFVRENLVVNGILKGIPLPVDVLKANIPGDDSAS